MMKISRITKSHGYTLIELAIVVTIIGVMAAGVMTVIQKKTEADRLRETKQKMERVADAIQLFFEGNGYIPCPARASLLENNVQYGVAMSYNADIRDCDPDPQNEPDLAANVDAGMGNAGVLPVKTLGLSDDDLFDGWGRKFTFRIATGNGNATDFLSKETLGNLSVMDIRGRELTFLGFPPPNNRGAAYVLISHGPNGAYAWLKSGLRLTPSVASADMEAENGDHANDVVYVKDQRASGFDDIVLFRKMADIAPPRLYVSPFRFASSTCSRAQIIIDEGLGSLATTHSSMASTITAAARVIYDLCYYAIPPTTNACIPNLRWLGGDTTPTKPYQDCHCYLDSQTMNYAYEEVSGGNERIGVCQPPLIVNVPAASACASDGARKDSGFDVTAGQPLTITAAGTWRPYGALNNDADGISSIYTATDPVPTAQTGALIAQIENGTWFAVGTSLTITPTASGRLYFAINEREGNCPALNDGVVSATLSN